MIQNGSLFKTLFNFAEMKCFSCGMSISNKDCNKQRGAVSCQAGQNVCFQLKLILLFTV